MLDVAVIIVNYRTAQLTIDSVAALLADPSMPQGSHIVVIDGASGDGSAEVIGKAINGNGWSDRVTLAPQDVNGGFAYGNNRGIEVVDADLGGAKSYLLLNPDTVVRSGAVLALADFLDQNPNVGIVGSRLEDPDGTLQACSFRFPTALGELESEARVGPVSLLLRHWRVVLPVSDRPSQADWVSGASMMIRRDVLEEVGQLDEGYFLYYEELDFCRRAVDLGWQCWTVPASRVVHLCGRATGLPSKGPKVNRRPSYWFQSRRRYFNKYHKGFGALASDLGWLTGQGIWHLRCWLERKPNGDAPRLVGDFLANRGLRAN
ncbi:glycosyl transferase family 2 [Devosia limi DSM 17137]|uniref:Glycosyl transferase family 2 n=1 Tax=Devosia limi DSM 17137 TaxID=1121477 RepID=A0A0F5LED9_9HYPH|nr:glycosyltransferase family 2 protein [Devosia limi]KKB80640.1 glycosyl transferase family 2 [Devosia limi DSM 17137]SHE49939.1 hypothetical protein SAMN02745223_00558 [Devosia limi DSM 17137]